MTTSTTTPGWQWAAEQAALPGSKILRIDLAPSVPMFFSAIDPSPPEGFLMGSRGVTSEEEPRHRVVITAPFYLSTFPVTQAQWLAIMGTTPQEMKAKGDAYGDLTAEGPLEPMVFINWNDAQDFASEFKSRFPQHHPTLPTEAQWEYACQAGTETEYFTGDGEEALRQAGWFGGNSGNTTHPVGELARNAFGLYDLHGNVWEWCLDGWDEAAYATRGAMEKDPFTDHTSNSFRVFRGGSFYFSAWDCRSAHRLWGTPGGRGWVQGFRLCLSSGPVAQSSRRAETSQGSGAGTGVGGGGTTTETEGPSAADWTQGSTLPKIPSA